MLNGGVSILHDNTSPHVTVVFQTLLRHFRWEVLEHLSYSPDFSPCEYHIFGLLQKVLKGRGFLEDNEVQAAVKNWFHNQHQSFFTEGMHHVMDRCDACFN
ncbi:hypothetical protein TNCV_4940361 [Trichonephila clavipes]|nr:hypothetical protein TNCV_4940361 [Trichonephila clavipes]